VQHVIGKHVHEELSAMAACAIERVGGVIQIAGSRGWHMALVYSGIHQHV
jgi:hypothetical protein